MGSWQIFALCSPAGTTTKTVRAVQMSLQLGALGLGGSSSDPDSANSPSFNLAWAEENSDVILDAVAATLGYDKSRVQIEFVPIESEGYYRRISEEHHEEHQRHPMRKLQDSSTGAFEMRVTVLLDEDLSDEDMVATANDLLSSLLGETTTSDNATANTTSNSSASSGLFGFVDTLVAQLEETGGEVPTGLEVTASRAPSVVSDFVLAVSSWLTSAWNQCSEECGWGFENRTIECSAGDDLLCDLAAKPEWRRTCENYVGCTFQVKCPLGQGAGIDCTGQAGIMYGTVGFVALCTGLCVCRRMQLACRAPEQGHVTLRSGISGNLKLETSFRIHKPDKELARKASIASAAEIVEVDDDKTKDGKTHIVWDLEAPQVQEWFAEQGTRLSLAKSQSFDRSPSAGSLPRISSNSRLGHNNDGASTAWSSPTAAADHEEADAEFELRIEELVAYVDNIMEMPDSEQPWSCKRNAGPEAPPARSAARSSARSGPLVPTMYQEGEKVEYYSQTLGKWIVGIMRVVTKRSDTSNAPIRYDVEVLSTKQKRLNVTLDLLRTPFKDGEKIELYSRRGGGSWLPGNIVGEQSATATQFGYRVALAGADSELESVPAHRLRRHFAVGEMVKAYRGVKIGWVKGQVTAQLPSDHDDLELELPDLNGSRPATEEGEPEDDSEQERVPSRASSRAQLSSKSPMNRSQRRLKTLASTDLAELVPTSVLERRGSMASVASTAVSAAAPAGEVWTWVAIAFEQDHNNVALREDQQEWFPTFLIRSES